MSRNVESTKVLNGELPQTALRKPFTKCCKDGPLFWCKKYFWEGQLRQDQGAHDQWEAWEEKNSFLNLLGRYRRVLGFVLPATLFNLFWWAFMIKQNLWNYFEDSWFMTLTMALGSVVAGMTSEGGGSVAFPVMTLIFNIKPSVARDFSLMIQSCGMTAAALTIFIMGIQLEWNTIILSTIGGAIGVIFGLEFIDPHLPPSLKKMGFVSIWFSFAFALFLLNKYHKRKTVNMVISLNLWKIVILLATGVIGGIFTSFSGSGLDICCFSILTLLFRVSEKVATPTSVVLMAGNTLVGFCWRGLIMQAITNKAWEFFTVSVPIVVIGAPFGSLLGSHFHRLVLASFVYISDTAALIGAFIIVPQTPALVGISVGIIVFGFCLFLALTKCGQIILSKHLEGASHVASDHCTAVQQDLLNNESQIMENGNEIKYKSPIPMTGWLQLTNTNRV